MADTQGLTGEGFAQGLGSGFLGIWTGIGANFNSTAAYNNAVATDIAANAGLADDRLASQERAQKSQNTMLIIVFIGIILLPIAALLILKMKK